MKRVVLSFLLTVLIGIHSVLYAEISATIVSRSDDTQVGILESWIKQTLPAINLTRLDFEHKEAQEVLSSLNLDFIPAVIFTGTPSQEESSRLKDKFNVSITQNRAAIPRKVIEETAVLELVKRKTIPGQLDLFVMSLCPFALEAETRLINYLKNHKLDIVLKLHYLVNVESNIFTSLHGDRELREDKRQLIIQKYWPKIFSDYLLMRQKNSYLNTLKELRVAPYGIEAKLPEAQTALFEDYHLAQELGISASPTFLWQNRYLISRLEQLADLPPFNADAHLARGQVASEALQPQGTKSGQSEPLKILFFHSPRCHACREVKETVLPAIMEKYRGRIEIVYYDINQPENFNELLELEAKYGILDRGSIPKMFIGDVALVGSRQIKAKLEKNIMANISRGKTGLFHGKVKERRLPERVLNLFKGFTVGTICWAGFTDGINPCAFTTLIFFLSFLSFAGYKKRQVLYLGTFFIIAVFLTYFSLGLGAFKFILQLKFYSKFAEIFYYAVGVLVLVLGIISLYDFYRFKKTGRTEDIKLKLPQSVKWRIQSIIGKGYRREGKVEGSQAHPIKLIFLSLVIGFIVSILESVCTGQVYLPTITFITKVPQLKVKAIFYLFLYNLMFIIPLVIIFVLALFGLTSERFGKFAQRHLAKIKLATALLFFSLFFLLWKLR